MINKRGDSELLLRALVFLIIFVLIAVILFIFINIQARGYAMKEQNLVKQIALLIDSARPGTEIFMDASSIYNIQLDEINKEVFVQAKIESKGKKYPYFNTDKVRLFFTKGELLRIEVDKLK